MAIERVRDQGFSAGLAWEGYDGLPDVYLVEIAPDPADPDKPTASTYLTDTDTAITPFLALFAP